MNGLDLVLVAMGLGFAVLGWRVGLVRVSLGLLGMVAGAAVGYLAAELALQRFDAAIGNPTAAVLVGIGVGALVGQFLVALPSQSLHAAVDQSRVSPVNQGLGAVVSLAALAVLTWAMATALALMPANGLGPLLRGSAVLTGMDRAVAYDAGGLFNHLPSGVVPDSSPRVFTGLGLLPLPDIPSPDPDDVPIEAVSAARESVVRVLGKTQCGQTVVGSGVIVAPELVMTNAHVVAAVREPIVTPTGRTLGLAGTTVVFDPAADAALVRVPGLIGRPLSLAPEPGEGELVAIAGYPGGGELEVAAAAVRGAVSATGEDVYGASESQRRVVVVSGPVGPGNSGGPLLTAEGRIAGLVFAAATVGGQTGYALAPAEMQRIMEQAGSTGRVLSECLPAGR